jgi:hypothetical protein
MPATYVVAAVDGNPAGWDALDWAAARAADRGRRLRIVHAVPNLAMLDPIGLTLEQTLANGQAILDNAIERTRLIASDIEISTTLCIGGGIRALVRAGSDATLIALGRGSRYGCTSTARRVAARAHVPVVLVDLTEPQASAARVILHVDRATSAAAVNFAHDAALTGFDLAVRGRSAHTADLERAALHVVGSAGHASRLLGCVAIVNSAARVDTPQHAATAS